MTYESAAHMSTYMEAQDRLAASPNFLKAVRDAADLTRERNRPEARKPRAINLLQALIGGVVGYTAANTATKALDLSPEFSQRLQTSAAVAGALMNMHKTGGARTKVAAAQAIRIGFLQALNERGLLKEGAFGLMVDPASIFSLPRSAAEGAAKVVNAAGTSAGALSAPSEAEEDLLKLRLQKDLLQQRVRAALVDRENRKIREALAK